MTHLKISKRISKIALIIIVVVSLICIIAFANAKKGGILYVKEGSSWTPVEKFYDVLPGQTYKLKVCIIPEDLGDIVFIKVSSDEEDGWIDWYTVGGSNRCVEFTWTCPSDAYYCNTFVVQLKKGVEDDPYKPKGAAYIVEGTLAGEDKPAHLHVIPEYAFGTAMGILSMMAGLGAYKKLRKN